MLTQTRSTDVETREVQLAENVDQLLANEYELYSKPLSGLTGTPGEVGVSLSKTDLEKIPNMPYFKGRLTRLARVLGFNGVQKCTGDVMNSGGMEIIIR